MQTMADNHRNTALFRFSKPNGTDRERERENEALGKRTPFVRCGFFIIHLTRSLVRFYFSSFPSPDHPENHTKILCTKRSE